MAKICAACGTVSLGRGSSETNNNLYDHKIVKEISRWHDAMYELLPAGSITSHSTLHGYVRRAIVGQTPHLSHIFRTLLFSAKTLTCTAKYQRLVQLCLARGTGGQKPEPSGIHKSTNHICQTQHRAVQSSPQKSAPQSHYRIKLFEQVQSVQKQRVRKRLVQTFAHHTSTFSRFIRTSQRLQR